jgi:plasmid stabilization system protein ParE
MAWRIEFSSQAEHDFDLIFDHLYESYISLGETHVDATEQASTRLRYIRVLSARIGLAPYRGTLRPEVAKGLRCATIERAIFWFKLEPERKTVRIAGVFFGGQDHIRRMTARILAGPRSE